ncbi:MAG: hypothetical protein AAGA46_13345 [Cyanobacteria bacterium P01_F01_bin.13]
MNKLLIAAGATLSAISVIAAAPAQAGTLTFGLEVDTSTQVTFGPFLAGRTVGGITLPDSINLVANDVTESFTVLDDPTQVTDGDIELTYDMLNGVLEDSYSAPLQSLLDGFGLTFDQVLQSVDDIFTVTQFSGTGLLTSDSSDLIGNSNNPSPFNITYANETNSVVVDGYAPKVALSCLSATCDITGNVSFSVGLVISEFVTFTSSLLADSSVTLTPEATTALGGLQQSAVLLQQLDPSLEVLDLAAVVSTISATTELLEVNPNDSVTDVEDPTVVEETTPEEQPTPEDPTAGGSITLETGPITFPSDDAGDYNDAQDVPEPSIMLGILATVALFSRQRSKQIATR